MYKVALLLKRFSEISCNMSNSETIHLKSASVLGQVCFDDPEKQVSACLVQLILYCF